ncbi:MAG UNVERIFIED_CONTAM: hypothetical protein LVR18_07140 [Planctomycetaceae bacterium]
MAFIFVEGNPDDSQSFGRKLFTDACECGEDFFAELVGLGIPEVDECGFAFEVICGDVATVAGWS